MLTGQVPISIFANHDFHKTTTPESGKVFLCRGDCSPIHRRSSVYGVYGTSTDCFWCYTWTADFPWVCLLFPMTSREKLIFVGSFVWLMHWGTCLSSLILDTVILKNSVRMLPPGF